MHSISEAARAANLPESTLRNWEKRELIPGLGTRVGRELTFATPEVYELGILAVLVSIADITVREACEALHARLATYEGFEWWQLPAKLYVFPHTIEGLKIVDDDDPMLEVYLGKVWTSWQDWDETFRREFGVSLPEGDPIEPAIWDCASHVTIYPHSIVRQTKRALEAAR